MDDEYHQKLEENKRLAEEATAKKRAKRLKKKQGRKQRKQIKISKEDNSITDEKSSKEESSENEETEAVKNKGANEESITSCFINIPKDESEAKTATGKKPLIDTEENQQHILKVSFEEKTNKKIQCKDDT